MVIEQLAIEKHLLTLWCAVFQLGELKLTSQYIISQKCEFANQTENNLSIGSFVQINNKRLYAVILPIDLNFQINRFCEFQ